VRTHMKHRGDCWQRFAEHDVYWFAVRESRCQQALLANVGRRRCAVQEPKLVTALPTQHRAREHRGAELVAQPDGHTAHVRHLNPPARRCQSDVTTAAVHRAATPLRKIPHIYGCIMSTLLRTAPWTMPRQVETCTRAATVPESPGPSLPLYRGGGTPRRAVQTWIASHTERMVPSAIADGARPLVDRDVAGRFVLAPRLPILAEELERDEELVAGERAFRTRVTSATALEARPSLVTRQPSVQRRRARRSWHRTCVGGALMLR
jgi:hypothetical protein